ncbi:MAG: hypothetical protein ACYDEN_04235 [Acidimicrobiales bacterium]
MTLHDAALLADQRRGRFHASPATASLSRHGQPVRRRVGWVLVEVGLRLAVSPAPPAPSCCS